MEPTDASAEPLNGRTGVTRQLLGATLGILLALIGVVFGMVQWRIGVLEDRMLRIEAIVNGRGERIAVLESARASDELSVARLETRIFAIEGHVSTLDSAMAAHRAATEPRPR